MTSCKRASAWTPTATGEPVHDPHGARLGRGAAALSKSGANGEPIPWRRDGTWNDTTKAASRPEAYALHQALVAAGEPHLAAVPLICFEWHQRPENVLAGHLTWTELPASDRPNTVRIEHHKTGELV